jgi:hypothetical protein
VVEPLALGASLHREGERRLVVARGDPKALLNRCSTVLLQGEEVAMSEAVFFYILTCIDSMADDGGPGTALIGFGRRVPGLLTEGGQGGRPVPFA